MTHPAVIAVALLTGIVASAVEAQSPNRPDVLFIAIDDLNDWIGPLDGHPQTVTPNMDKLAAQGMVFSNAHSPAMVCNPSRTALMTGISPASSGVYGNQTDWRRAERLQGIPTIPRYFNDRGYKSYGAGKLFHASTYNPWAYFGYNDTTAWDAYFPSLDRQLPNEIRPHERPANGTPLSINFDWAAVNATDMAMGDGQVVSWSVDQILTADDSPRFNAIGIYRPHLPWYVSQKYLDMHPLDEIVLPTVPENDLEDIPEYPLRNARRGGFAPMAINDWVMEDETLDRWREAVQAYLASISYADAMVGHLLDALEQSGRSDNTIVILFSDHGWHLGEKSHWRKTTLWRESTRVPLIVIAPGVTQPGSETDSVVSLMDLYPTLVELAGLDTPRHVEGRSLVPLLKNPAVAWEHAAVSTNGFENHAISTDRYRYLRYPDGTEEFYDLDADPDEWRNLAANPRYASVKAEVAGWLPDHNEPVDAAASRTAE